MVGALYPEVANVGAGASVSANATCGEDVPDTYCRLSFRGGVCGVCDGQSSDPGRRHPPSAIVDGTEQWWQSPTLATGQQYEWVTVTLDLKQVRQLSPL